ncbi:MAG TPA: DEAD/DEAH box helicase [Thermoanaerobaculia bacterium]|nr:DEAD/DEAH box helicase [Thermoanaerobaculia bacterium]
MAATSSAFHLLHPKVRKWLWDQGWQELRGFQEEAIPAVLHGQDDLVIAASTASGKTEAAFLPILTALADDFGGSVRALYVSPLKALINDQFDRLERLCEELEMPVARWHGDVAASRKRKVLDRPEGILIITPESLEALFVRQGPKVRPLFERLGFVVVDELHAFLGAERGRQLQSLLHRVELAVRRRVPRIALSATLGDLSLACEFLRPGGGEAVRRIVSTGDGQELKVQVRGYRVVPPRLSATQAEAMAAAGRPPDLEDLVEGDALEISLHLFDKLRGGHHLVFANSRSNVELFADLLRRHCETRGIPNEFWAHHGSLSRELREEAEAAIKDRARPASAVCTTTLELGIDVGAIESVAQVGPPPSVASLRQRLGRSGRQGGAAVLRAYVREPEIGKDVAPQWRLRSDLVQTIAAVQLLVAGWCEPPEPAALHLSTLVQQLLSAIAQHGSLRAGQAWQALCHGGAFPGVSQALFAELLRSLGSRELIRQVHSGELVLELTGERIVNHYEFYAAFATSDEYRLTSGGRTLGTLPISYPLFPGLCIVFAGRRWEVVSVDEEHKVVDLKPAFGARLPGFEGTRGAAVHDRVRREMLAVYGSTSMPAFLDARARDLLEEGRGHFARLGLEKRRILGDGRDTLLFCWRGDRVLDTLSVWLNERGFRVAQEGVALVLEGADPGEVRAELVHLACQAPPGPLGLALSVVNKRTEKFHPYLTDELLAADWASSRIDVQGAWEAIREVAGFDKVPGKVPASPKPRSRR